MGAGSFGRVEREGVRRGVFEGYSGRRAHQMTGIETHLFRAVVVNGHRALSLPQGLLERGGDPFAGIFADGQTVDDQLDRVDFVPVEPHSGRNLPNFSIDTDINESFAGQRFEQFAIMALAPFDDRGHQGDSPAGESLEDQSGDAFVGVVHHLFAGDRGVGPRRPCVKQTQEIVDLGNGADRRTGVLVGRFLFDGDDGAQSGDFIHVGPLHRADELAGIGGERLHVAALPFGIDGVERQRRFARTAQSGDDR